MRNFLLIVDVQATPVINIANFKASRNDGKPFEPGEKEALYDKLNNQTKLFFNSKLERISSIIDQYKRNNDGIIILEDANVPATVNNAIIHALGNYPHIIIRKAVFNGSSYILQAIEIMNLRIKQIEVCGCMTECCVLQTVIGLRKALTPQKVKVIKDACFDKDWDEQFISDPSLRLS